MRKIFTLMLVCILLVSLLPGQAEEAAHQEIIDQLNLLVTTFLNKENLEFESDDDSFYVDLKLDSSLGSATAVIFVDYDMIQVMISPDLKVIPENRDKLAIFTTLLNWELFYSQFTMNYEKNRFFTRTIQYVESALPGLEEMEVLFYSAWGTLDKYGDALAQISLMGADPHQVFARVKAN